MQVGGTHAADERQTCAESEDERHDPRSVQLRLQEVGVDLLQLMNSRDRVEMRGAVLGRGVLQRFEVRARNHGRGDGIGKDLVLELVDLGEREVGALDRRLEGVVERDERGDAEVNDHEYDEAVDEDAQ